MRNMRKFFIPSNCSDNVIHFNFNLMLFTLVCRAPSGNSIIYATLNKALQGYSVKQNCVNGTTYCNALPIEVKVYEYEPTSSIYC